MLTDDRQSAWHQFDSGFRAVPCVFARIAKVATVNSRHARGRVCSEFLFCTGDFRALPARLVRILGCFRRSADALAQSFAGCISLRLSGESLRNCFLGRVL
jgi:hypothetical protein